MQIPVNDEFRRILHEIRAEQKTEAEWAESESDDMFQSQSFDGGYDATEHAFCFSFYAPNGDEYWFQFTLEEVEAFLAGRKSSIEGRKAD